VRTDLLLCGRWQTSAQACICCLKKVINGTKTVQNEVRYRDSRSAKAEKEDKFSIQPFNEDMQGRFLE